MAACRKVAVRFSAAGILVLCFTLWSAEPQGTQPPPAARIAERPVAVGGGEIGDLLRKWYADGTAAGNAGDYYDNRDGGHSSLNLKPYPQLQKIEYSNDQIKARLHWGMQGKILPYVVFGNSSTSAAPEQNGSIPRSYYTNSRGLEFLFAQYARNNLYIYPEHRDYDPGHNGMGGYGDLFPTNTPYLIVSQGSSGSDQPFMRALPYVLAAFRPDVKKRLIQSGLLMPTIQMILRFTCKNLKGSKDYLTGKAHPTVFEDANLDTKQMVEMAHAITLSNIPPIALIEVLQENVPAQGVDYYEPELTEKLADTPAVIARIFRGSGFTRTMKVSAEKSVDLNKRPLRYYWVILRGNPQKIKIEPQNSSGSVVEITITYFPRSAIAENSSMESNRVDIGAFVHNGSYYSPPAFITFYTLDNEARTYRPDNKPLEIAYDVGTPAISVADWQAFFSALDPHAESTSYGFLRRQFSAEGIAALSKVSEAFHKIHDALPALREKQEKAAAANKKAQEAVKAVQTKLSSSENADRTRQSKESGKIVESSKKELAAAIETQKAAAGDFQAARRAVDEAEKSERRVLENPMPRLNRSAEAVVQELLHSMLRDPELWSVNEKEFEQLYESADRKNKEEFDKVRQLLGIYGIAENSTGFPLRFKFLQDNRRNLSERLTCFEEGMIARFNATALSRIVLPGLFDSKWRVNFVDHRIASIKEWRDIYCYAPDGTPMGWRRYQPDGVMEFNAEGLLVLDKDSQGRCVRARVVNYELEPQDIESKKRPAITFRRRVKIVPADIVHEYEYQGPDDWKGHVKQFRK
jgi:hypothetical protein